jgi:hypothetical protein
VDALGLALAERALPPSVVGGPLVARRGSLFALHELLVRLLVAARDANEGE